MGHEVLPHISNRFIDRVLVVDQQSGKQDRCRVPAVAGGFEGGAIAANLADSRAAANGCARPHTTNFELTRPLVKA